MRSIGRELRNTIAAVEMGDLRPAGARFAARVAAIELLEFHVLDRLRYLEARAPVPPDLQALGRDATRLRRRMEAANDRVVRRLRRAISSRRQTPERFLRALLRHAGPSGPSGRYDALDLLVEGLLRGGPLAEERAVLEPEMVAFQPTPARAILALLERGSIRQDDIFCDLGSGLGRVVILVALLTGARARGIELEPAYCEYAARCARGLNVPGVELVQADARDASLADATVFFLFTPFRGALLRDVLARLQAEARARPIRICTYGPCTAEVARANWLASADGRTPGEHDVAVFRASPRASTRPTPLTP
jgi:SAM-dependent methyltransferase